ncbi:MAG: tetratricopeptide repeat protein [Saprospiraceae bacterium]|nr:tetratricopeptide repeat protein [Saprospiraceae bacterium]MBK9630016.1 tetratricopeptide repeat protein [Saprospiraceae bacterium]
MKNAIFASFKNNLVSMNKKILLYLFFSISGISLTSQSLQIGIQMLQNENYNGALQAFSKLNASDPKNPIYPYYIGEVHYAMENNSAAQSSYQAGLNISSKCDECKIGLGKIELDKGNVTEAEKYFDSALKGNSKNHRIIAMVGDAWLFGRNPQPVKALEYLTKARDLDPKIATYWIHMGDAQYVKKDLGSAMTAYETAVEKDKNDPETYLKMAKIWAAGNKYDLGIENLEKAIALKPDYALAYKELYEQLIRNKNYNKVIPVLEKYVALTGDDVDAKVRLIKFLCFQAKDYERAISEGIKVLNAHPEQYTIHRWLAWSYGEMENYQESYNQSKLLMDAILQDTSRKSFSSDFEYLAKASMKLKKYEEADIAYGKVIEFEPSRAPEIYGLLAKSYYDEKNYAKSSEWYLKKSQSQPLNHTEQYYLGLSKYYMGEFKLADSSFAIVLIATPNYAQGWLWRARSNTSLDSAQLQGLAKPHYEKYVEIASTDPERNKKYLIESYRYLGTYFVQREENNAALPFFEKIKALDPADKEAEFAIKILKGK